MKDYPDWRYWPKYEGGVSMDPNARYPNGAHWDKVMVGPRLTDKKIKGYQKRGFYSSEYRAARKELMDKKSFKKRMNDATKELPDSPNFWRADDGRMIYSPK